MNRYHSFLKGDLVKVTNVGTFAWGGYRPLVGRIKRFFTGKHAGYAMLMDDSIVDLEYAVRLEGRSVKVALALMLYVQSDQHLRDEDNAAYNAFFHVHLN